MVIVIVLVAFLFLGGGLGASAPVNGSAAGSFYQPPPAPGPIGAQWATTASALVPPPPGTFTRAQPPLGAPPLPGGWRSPGDTAINKPTITVPVRPSTGPAMESSSGVGHF